MKSFFSAMSLSLTVLMSPNITASEDGIETSPISHERFGKLAERYGTKIVSGYEQSVDNEVTQRVDSVFLLIVKGDELEKFNENYKIESQELTSETEN